MTNDFLALGAGFLNYKRGSLPFNYLGLPIGENPRRVSTWDYMIQVIRGRLQSWQHRSISLGGRLVLLNSFLNSTPIFYLSYMKMLVRVWKEVVSLQRDFLWGEHGGEENHMGYVVRYICKPKSDGRIFRLLMFVC